MLINLNSVRDFLLSWLLICYGSPITYQWRDAMYMRITTMSYDPDREGEFMAIADAARDEMKGIEGLQTIRGIRVADGKVVIGASYDTEESASAAMPKIQMILGKLAAVLNAPPEMQEGPIIWEL